MTKRVVCLSLLLLALCGVYAQSISQYEYWTDDGYATRSVVDAGADDVSLTVSTATLGAGVHFLNFRAKGSDGTWGNFYRYIYYIPTLKNDASGSLSLDYWLDDDNAGQKSMGVDNGNVALTLNISSLKAGVHFFNCTPISTTSGRGNSERYLFYVPMSPNQTTVSAVKGYEYWFDDNYSAVVKKQAEAGEQVLSISLEGLTSGVHYFNCRALNERGEYGCPIREMFYIPQTEINTEAKIAKSVYWLDDDYEHRKEIASENTDYAFSIDISKLASGVHYFNYRAVDNKGVWGSATRQMFYIARIENPAHSGTISYEYWLDDNTEQKVAGTGAASEYVFNVDVSSLDYGSHTFNFRAKDPLDQWGETFVSTFETFLLGDVNGDGFVTMTDAIMMMSFILGENPEIFNQSAADVNSDGIVTVTDVSLVIDKINAANMPEAQKYAYIGGGAAYTDVMIRQNETASYGWTNTSDYRTYSFTVNDGDYLWFIFPSDTEVRQIETDQIQIPYTESQIEVNGLKYNVYKSMVRVNSGPITTDVYFKEKYYAYMGGGANYPDIMIEQNQTSQYGATISSNVRKYTLNINTGDYIWFIFPSDARAIQIGSDPSAMPFTESQITVNGLQYYCYKSTQRLFGGEYTIDVYF